MTESQIQSRDQLALLNSTVPKLVDHYVDMLAIGWRQRANRLVNPALEFSDLLESDDRLQAALESLILLGKPAGRHLQALLGEPIRRGEMFVLGLYALSIEHQPLLDACRDVAAALPDLQDALAAAFEWAKASPMLQTSVAGLPAPMRMQVVGARYRDFEGMDQYTLAWLRTVEPVAENISALCRLIRRLGRVDLAPATLRYLDHEQADVRLSAAYAILTLAPTAHTPDALKKLDELLGADMPAIREEAVQCAILHYPAWTTRILDRLAKDGDATRLYLLALGWAGRIDAVPVLIKHLEDIRHSRAAGASLALITGSVPTRDGWLGAKPTPVKSEDGNDDKIPGADVDGNLPWPCAAAFDTWWRQHASRFSADQRYFAGRPLDPNWLATLLMSGPLAWRQMAAEHRQRLTKTPLFPVRLRACAQRALFPELN